MNDILKSDVFFFVTTVAVIVITVLVGVLIAYVIRIMSKVSYIADKAKQQTDLLSEDLGELRANMKQGFKLRHLGKFFWNIAKRK